MGHVGLYIGNGFVVEARGGLIMVLLRQNYLLEHGGIGVFFDWLEYDIKSEGGKALVGESK